MNAIASAVDRLGFALLTFSIVAAPVPFGSNSSGFAGFFGLLIGIALIGCRVLPAPRPETQRLVSAALGVAAAVLLLSIVQVLPAWSDGFAYPIWGQASGLIDSSAAAPVSPSRYQPLYSVGYVLLPLAVFISTLAYVRRDDHYMRLVHIVLGVGSLVALICLVQFTLTPGALLWAEKRHYIGSFTGTFVNRNSAATYFGVLLILSLALSLRQATETRPYGLLFLRRNLARNERFQLIRLAIYMVWASVFATALFLTGSRAGVASSLAAVAGLLAAFTFLALRPRFRLAKALGLTVLCVGLVIFVAAAFGDTWLGRLGAHGLFDEARACVYWSTWAAIKDHVWLGTGLGTFQDVFPSYRRPECGILGSWEMAHSVFVEGWLALGVSFLVCLGIAYRELLVSYARGLRLRRRRRFVPLASLAVLLLVTLHSAIDFSLQIPAVAILVAAVLGAGAAVSLGKARSAAPSA